MIPRNGRTACGRHWTCDAIGYRIEPTGLSCSVPGSLWAEGRPSDRSPERPPCAGGGLLWKKLGLPAVGGPCGETAARKALVRVAHDLGELGLQLGLGWQSGPVLGHDDAVLMHLQQLDLLAADLGAEDQSDRGLLARLTVVTVEPLEVQLHLTLEPRVELADLQFDGDQPT